MTWNLTFMVKHSISKEEMGEIELQQILTEFTIKLQHLDKIREGYQQHQNKKLFIVMQLIMDSTI